MATMKHQFEFLAGTYLGDELFFNKYTLSLSFYSVGDPALNQNIALDRMTYFIYDVIQRSVFIQEEDEEAINNFTNAGIPVLTVPGSAPVDPLVVGIIALKLNAIMDGILIIEEAELSSYVGSGISYMWDSGDDTEEIHSIVNDSDDTKWWGVSGPRFTSYASDADVTKLEKAKPFPVTWETLGLEWGVVESEYDPENPTPSGKGNGTIIKANFTG